jgi:hypothetical protein
MRRWHSVKKGKAEKTDRVRDMYAITGVTCFKQPFPSSRLVRDAAPVCWQEASIGPMGAPVKRTLCQIPVLCRLEARLSRGSGCG